MVAERAVRDDEPAAGVELVGISKRFGSVTAVDRLSLAARIGEFLTLLGPSGCGKTTTLRLIGGFARPTAGEVRIGGEPMTGRPPFLRPVNTVFQNFALFPHMTVAENIAYGLRMAGIDRREQARRVAWALELVRLLGAEQRRPGELSGGQQQRVALARALVKQPAVLLLDEPLGALDLTLRRSMQDELKRIQREVGATFIYVTHDQEEALLMSDRIAVMDAGRVLQLGTPADVYDAPRSRFVAGFIGQSNLLEGILRSNQGGLGVVEVPGVGLLAGTMPGSGSVGSAVTLAIRPERAHLHRGGVEAPVGGWQELVGTLTDLRYVGTHWRLTVTLDDETYLVVHWQRRGEDVPVPRQGDRVELRFRADEAMVLVE